MIDVGAVVPPGGHSDSCLAHNRNPTVVRLPVECVDTSGDFF